MKHLNFRAVIISAFAVFSAIVTTATAFAESSETHEVTESISSNTSETSNASEADSDTSDTSNDGESSTPRVSENPQLKAELQNDELYNYLMKYLNDPENFKADGSGVLIDESKINLPNANNSENASNTSTYNYHTENSNGEKMMYTVATRDGSIFYIVIDKSGETENVYFLNAVDAVDLASIIKSGKTESDTYTPQEKDIISEAGDTTKASSEDNASDTSASSSSDTSDQGSAARAQNQKSDTSLYIIVGVAAIAIIGIAAYKKIGPGKKKKAPAFDELSDDDDEEEETYSEDEYEEEQEQEEVGNFDDDDT